MRVLFSLSSQPHHPKPCLKAGLKGNLGNVRVEGIGWANEYRADYRPFGGTEWTNSNLNSKTSYRLGFLGLQKDKESNLGDHGVRKYDSEIGRFLAIDPLWEKYNTLNPYQYSGNSPVMRLDFNGFAESRFNDYKYNVNIKAPNNELDVLSDFDSFVTFKLSGSDNRYYLFAKPDGSIKEHYQPGPIHAGMELSTLLFDYGGVKYKSFTKANAKENLILWTGAIFPNIYNDYQAHHIFPTNFAKDFEKLGININEPWFM